MRVSGDSEGPLPTLPTLPLLLRLSDHLKQAWSAGSSAQAPNLADFLPPTNNLLRLASLQELIRVDLEMRWQRGLPALLESYVQQFPELGAVTSLPADLIYHEYRVRRQHGDRPVLTHYQERFPTQYPRLLVIAKGDTNPSESRASSPPAPTPVASTPEAVPIASSETLTPARSTPAPVESDKKGGEKFNPAAATPSGERKAVPIEAPETLTPAQSTPAPAESGKKGGEKSKPAAATPSGERKNVVPMVGGYRLLQRLGKGASGEVWKAEAPGGVEVAVKRLTRTLKAHEAQAELQSLEHVKRLRHNYLTQIHAFWVHKGRLHVAMELTDGSLSDEVERCRDQGLPGIAPERLLRYMREAAEALDYLHGENVLHRDIKPANILLLQGHVKVADFGLARSLPNSQSMIQGTFCGTPYFMPPEVWENKFSIHSDQWSLAVTYLELRLNRRVFKSTSQVSLMREIRGGKIDLTPLAKDEQRILRRALHPSPRERYPSCTAFAQALEAVLQPPPPRPQRRRIWMMVALLACLNAAALLISLFFWLRSGPARIQPVTEVTQTLDTGREVSFQLTFRRENYGGPLHLVAEQEWPHVTIQGEAREGEDSATVWVRADAKAEPRMYPIHLKPAEKNVEGSLTIELTILYLPADFVATPAEPEKDERGVEYHKRISRRLNEKSSVEFVLVPRKAEDWQGGAGGDPPTFYISRYKISREQFQFIAKKITKVDSKWEKHADDDATPVRDVTVEDAHRVAKWLGGRLPSIEQWDKAAGRYHPSRNHDPREGPYKGRWKEGGLRIAVGELRAPLPIDSPQTEDDESVYGGRDMAGNGSEWTRNTWGRKEVPLPHPTNEHDNDNDVYLRGWSFEKPNPLTFAALDEDDDRKYYRTEKYKQTSPSLGFRVVLEPNR